jgi:hypothetical protein
MAAGARRALTFREAGWPDDVLYRSMCAVRGMGGQITRYEAEAGRLEGRVSTWAMALVLQVRVTAEGDGGTRLVVETVAADPRRRFDLGAGARALRRFRAALARESGPPGG